MEDEADLLATEAAHVVNLISGPDRSTRTVPDVGGVERSHQMQQGGLPAARRPGDRNELPLLDGQVDAVEGSDTALVDLDDVAKLDGESGSPVVGVAGRRRHS